MNLVLLGAPGAGKGFISDFIKNNFNFLHISTGNILREKMKQKTKLGQTAENYINQGLLVPDDLICNMLDEYLNYVKSKNIIFDGFPRTIAQAQILQNKIKIDKVILVNADDEIIVQRITNRRACPKCNTFYSKNDFDGVCPKCNEKFVSRDDDKPEVVKNRLKVYKKQTKPVIDFYKEKIIEVDNSKSQQNTINQLNQIFENLKVEYDL